MRTAREVTLALVAFNSIHLAALIRLAAFGVIAVHAGIGLAKPTELTIVSWNLEHMMSQTQFERWRAFCEPLGWDDEKAGDTRPPTITYCSAHSGLSFPDKRPESKPLRTWATYQEKIQGLRQHAIKLDADIYALQEVGDKNAVQQLLPTTNYDIFVTQGPMFQQIAFAVHKRLAATPTAQQIDSIAQMDSQGHAVRPGLELTLRFAERTLKILNLHLKASCARYVIDDPDLSQTRDAAHRDAVIEGCSVLRKQVPELERWVDARAAAGEYYMIVGDFNRDLEWEIRNRVPARLEGSDSANPADPITERTRIGGLLFELSDNSPDGASLWLIRQNIKAGRYQGRITCHPGIDNILVSEPLSRELSVDPNTLWFEGTDYGLGAYDIDRPRLSDHCPFAVRLPFR